MPDVFANVIGIGERQHNEIMSLAIAQGARAGCLGLLVLGLAVDDGSGRFAGVFAHALPNTHYVAASRIDNLAAALLDLLQGRQFRSERRYDHHILGLQIGNFGLLVFPHQVLNA